LHCVLVAAVATHASPPSAPVPAPLATVVLPTRRT
jgi:hypothetical protein